MGYDLHPGARAREDVGVNDSAVCEPGGTFVVVVLLTEDDDESQLAGTRERKSMCLSLRAIYLI